MLAPEVEKFDPPKIRTGLEKCENIGSIIEKINCNTFYENIVVTIPDAIRIPSVIQETIVQDNDYYKLSKCSLTEFLEPNFIEYFVKKGKLHCLTTGRNCIVENCAAITPDGILTIHLLKYVYEMLGIQGQEQKYGFYNVNIDLKNLKQNIIDRMKQSSVTKEVFDFHLVWEPDSDDVCPSSIAKYFSDREVEVSVCSAKVTCLNPNVSRVPSIEQVEEVVEWIGMLAHNAGMQPKHDYISTYEEPKTDMALETNNISILFTKGFFTPITIEKVCRNLAEYVSTRELSNYWAGLSYQSRDSSPWCWKPSSPRMFQAFECCSSIFVTQKYFIRHTIGQLKYT